MGSYTVAAIVAVGLAIVLDWTLLAPRLIAQRGFWAAYAIVFGFQLVVNGLLTAAPIVRYDPGVIVGWRLAYAPVEDLLFGFALVLLTLSAWTRLGRSRGGGRGPHAAGSARRP